MFFKILKDNNVEFYKQTNQLKTYKPKDEKPAETYSSGQTQPTEATQTVNPESETMLDDEESILFISGLDL